MQLENELKSQERDYEQKLGELTLQNQGKSNDVTMLKLSNNELEQKIKQSESQLQALKDSMAQLQGRFDKISQKMTGECVSNQLLKQVILSLAQGWKDVADRLEDTDVTDVVDELLDALNAGCSGGGDKSDLVNAVDAFRNQCKQLILAGISAGLQQVKNTESVRYTSISEKCNKLNEELKSLLQKESAHQSELFNTKRQLSDKLVENSILQQKIEKLEERVKQLSAVNEEYLDLKNQNSSTASELTANQQTIELLQEKKRELESQFAQLGEEKQQEQQARRESQ